MRKKLINFQEGDEVVCDDLQKLGYIPTSLRTKIKQRIEAMHNSYYARAMELFQRFDLDYVGNKTPSPISYQRASDT